MTPTSTPPAPAVAVVRGDTVAELDPRALENLTELVGGPAELRELLDDFLGRYAPSLLVEVRAAHERGDAADLRRTAHSLKSNAASFGARALAGACLALESLAATGSLEGAAEAVRAVEDAHARLVPILVALKESLPD